MFPPAALRMPRLETRLTNDDARKPLPASCFTSGEDMDSRVYLLAAAVLLALGSVVVAVAGCLACTSASVAVPVRERSPQHAHH